MKQPKSPTRAQKIIISSFRLKSQNWFVFSETKDELIIIHRHTGTKKKLRKDLV